MIRIELATGDVYDEKIKYLNLFSDSSKKEIIIEFLGFGQIFSHDEWALLVSGIPQTDRREYFGLSKLRPMLKEIGTTAELNLFFDSFDFAKKVALGLISGTSMTKYLEDAAIGGYSPHGLFGTHMNEHSYILPKEITGSDKDFELLVKNNKLGRISIFKDDEVKSTIYYVPSITPIVTPFDMTKSAKKLWDKVKEESQKREYPY